MLHSGSQTQKNFTEHNPQFSYAPSEIQPALWTGKLQKNVGLGAAKLLTCFGAHIMNLVVAFICLGPALTRMVTILLIFQNVPFVGSLKYLIWGNKWFKCEVPAFEPSYVSLWQTTNMNIHLSTEFKTEDKLEYQFIPVTSGEMTFKVRAPNDVYVALTTAPTEGDPMYEVSYKIILFEDT